MYKTPNKIKYVCMYVCTSALLHSFTPAPSHPRFPVCFAQNRFMNLSAYYFTSQRISNNPPCGPSLHVLHVQKLVCKIDGTGTSYLQGVRTITGNCQFQWATDQVSNCLYKKFSGTCYILFLHAWVFCEIIDVTLEFQYSVKAGWGWFELNYTKPVDSAFCTF